MMASQLANDLAATGYGIVPHFFPSDLVATLRTELQAFDRDGALRQAGIGRDGGVKTTVRSDRILWLEAAAATDAQSQALARLDALRTDLAHELFLSLPELECHLALYPPGGHYDKHVDSFRGQAKRHISIVLYLNESWVPADGGALRLYKQGSQTEWARDVLPEGGTLACFRSDSIWHEVLPAHRPRMSLTGWFRSP